MGSIAEKYSKHIFITNDNPRNENSDKIISDIKNGLKTKKHTIIKTYSNYIIFAPGLLFIILPVIAARPCLERKLNIAAIIGLLFTSTLIIMSYSNFFNT